MKRLLAALLLAPAIAAGQMLWTKPPINDSVSGGAAGSFTSVTASGQFLGNGATCGTAPSYSFSAEPTLGFFRQGAGAVSLCNNGTEGIRLQTGLLFLIDPTAEIRFGALGDAHLAYISADILSMKNGATAQEWRVYGTTTGPKYLSMKHDGTNGVIDTAASSGILSLAPTNATGVTIGKALTQATSITSSTATFPITGLAAAAGGSVSLVGGAGSSTTGGAVAITGGAATSGAGASITLTAGAAAGGTNSGGDVNLVPTAAVSTGTPGEVKINSARGFFDACWQQYLPASVPVSGTSYTFFLANRAYRVVAASIINSSTSTVPTVDVFKDTSTNAPGAGATTLTGVMTFSATANTRVTGTPSATVTATNLAAGDRLSAKFAGTVGAITGAIVCVTLVPI